MNIIDKLKKKSNRVNFKLKDLILKLIKIIFYNKILVKFARFYGGFLRHIFHILTSMNKYTFKFCFITNNSINARFLARYIGLKLKRKFPLFTVINPLKKELKKLATKKREKKAFSLFNLFSNKLNDRSKFTGYKNTFKNMVIFLYNRFKEISIFYYTKNLTFITIDFLIFFFILKKKLKKISSYKS
jgi:hypothetical protein